MMYPKAKNPSLLAVQLTSVIASVKKLTRIFLCLRLVLYLTEFIYAQSLIDT